MQKVDSIEKCTTLPGLPKKKKRKELKRENTERRNSKRENKFNSISESKEEVNMGTRAGRRKSRVHYDTMNLGIMGDVVHNMVQLQERQYLEQSQVI